MGKKLEQFEAAAELNGAVCKNPTACGTYEGISKWLAIRLLFNVWDQLEVVLKIWDCNVGPNQAKSFQNERVVERGSKPLKW